jgi:hypothetical protein
LQQGKLLARNDAQALGRLRIGHHDGERLGFPPLALAEPSHRGVIPRVAREVKATDALEGNDSPGSQQAPRFVQRVTHNRLAMGIHQLQPRTACRTGIRLRVEAPVRGVVVLSLARGAHPERPS